MHRTRDSPNRIHLWATISTHTAIHGHRSISTRTRSHHIVVLFQEFVRRIPHWAREVMHHKDIIRFLFGAGEESITVQDVRYVTRTVGRQQLGVVERPTVGHDTVRVINGIAQGPSTPTAVSRSSYRECSPHCS